MKFNCGETLAEKKQRLGQWHRWFAWRPVRVGEKECRWLEYVERKGRYYASIRDGTWFWDYRVADTRLRLTVQKIRTVAAALRANQREP